MALGCNLQDLVALRMRTVTCPLDRLKAMVHLQVQHLLTAKLTVKCRVAVLWVQVAVLWVQVVKAKQITESRRRTLVVQIYRLPTLVEMYRQMLLAPSATTQEGATTTPLLMTETTLPTMV